MSNVIRTSNPKDWRCFYCDEVFTTEVDARNHFGSLEGSETACRIKAPGEFALLQALRNAEEALARYRAEDSDALRAMWSMTADHQTALRREEEKGYARALRDTNYKEPALETPELRFHEGERQSYLKAVELSVASGMLGDGDKSDLLDMYQRLWPRAPSDVRANALKALEQPAPVCTCTPPKSESHGNWGSITSGKIDHNCPIHWQQTLTQNGQSE